MACGRTTVKGARRPVVCRRLLEGWQAAGCRDGPMSGEERLNGWTRCLRVLAPVLGSRAIGVRAASNRLGRNGWIRLETVGFGWRTVGFGWRSSSSAQDGWRWEAHGSGRARGGATARGRSARGAGGWARHGRPPIQGRGRRLGYAPLLIHRAISAGRSSGYGDWRGGVCS